eukprot:762090-Pyramimonas_sp.AAC.1
MPPQLCPCVGAPARNARCCAAWTAESVSAGPSRGRAAEVLQEHIMLSVRHADSAQPEAGPLAADHELPSQLHPAAEDVEPRQEAVDALPRQSVEARQSRYCRRPTDHI